MSQFYAAQKVILGKLDDYKSEQAALDDKYKGIRVFGLTLPELQEAITIARHHGWKPKSERT